MLKKPSIRQLIVVLLLLTGPLTQFQTLYACELMEHDHERASMVCCCDEPGHMDMIGQDQTDMMDGDCCEITYEPSEITQASGSQSQQVLLLDAAQPPPQLLAFILPEIPINNGVHFEPDLSSPLPDKPVYLLTRRFRI